MLLARLLARWWFWVAAIALLFGAPLVRALTARRTLSMPPVLGSFPEFSLRSDRGDLVTASNLRGRVFIANAFDRLETGSALSTMTALQHRTRNLGDAVWLLSFAKGLDPDALRDVRRSQRAGQRWWLVAGAPQGEDPFGSSRTLLLVDGRSRIRGRYQAVNTDDVERLLRDAALVAELR